MGVEEIGQVFKCSLCGNIVEVLHVGGAELVCCGKPMNLLEEKIEDEGKEKHVPVIEKTETGVKVKVGSVPHPMEVGHFIEWIEVISDSGSCKMFLNPGSLPEADFEVSGNVLSARAYCNVHGLWKSQ